MAVSALDDQETLTKKGEVRADILKIEHLTMRFGGLVAVSDFNLDCPKGKLWADWPNGSGKTTVFNIITGFYKPTAGKVYLDGDDITSFTPTEFAQRANPYFPNSRVFRNLSVFDNVMIGDTCA